MNMKFRKFLVMLLVFSLIITPFDFQLNASRASSHKIAIEKKSLANNRYPIYYLSTEEKAGSPYVEASETIKNKVDYKATGIIVLKFDVSRTEYLPNSEGLVEFVIQNLLDHDVNVSIDIRVPYFVEVKNNKVHWERNNSNGDADWLFGVPLKFSNFSPEEKLNITFTLIGRIGEYKEGKLIISVYNTDTGELFLTKDKTINSRPAFTAEAQFNPFLLNVSKTNVSFLIINITNDAPYEIDNISVEIKEVPENLIFEKYSVLIDKIEAGTNTTVEIKATISGPGVYQIAVLINCTAGLDAIRPNLLAVTKKVIIFDEGHNQYYRFASEYMDGFIEIAREFAPVIISKQPFKGALFSTQVAQLIVLPPPQPATADPGDTTSPIFDNDEITTLQNFIENGGSLLIMGNWYQYFWPDNPNSFNALTNKYGIYWWDGDVYDTVSYEQSYYHVIAKTFADNEVAKIISLGIDAVHYAGTAFKIISPEVPTEIYPVLLGNENYTFLTLGTIDEQKIAEGKDVIMMLAAVVKGVGKIFASGSAYAFSSYYYFEQNKQLVKNILTWLMGVKKLELSITGVPYEITVGKEIVAEVTITNNGVEEIRQINVSISLSPGLVNKNGTSIYSIELLKPGNQVKIRWIITANKEGTYSMTFNLVASNYPESITKRLLVIYKKPEAQYPIELIASASIIAIIVVISVIVVYLRRRGMQ